MRLHRMKHEALRGGNTFRLTNLGNILLVSTPDMTDIWEKSTDIKVEDEIQFSKVKI